MMINTVSPDGSRTGGPLPSSSQAPPNASYSGLIECPCTSRIVRGPPQHASRTASTCPKPVLRIDDCFAAVASLSPALTIASNTTIASATQPPGCFFTARNGTAGAVFNTLASSTVTCGSQTAPPASLTSFGQASSLVDLNLTVSGPTGLVTITMTGPGDVWFGVGFGATVMADLP